MSTADKPRPVEGIVGREEFKPGELPEGSTLARCPVCGSEAELWLHSLDFEHGPINKAVMCSNGEPFLPQDGLFDCCLLCMPPNGFYRPTVREAVKYWNEYAAALIAMRETNLTPNKD
jgi:hypothetical protein